MPLCVFLDTRVLKFVVAVSAYDHVIYCCLLNSRDLSLYGTAHELFSIPIAKCNHRLCANHFSCLIMQDGREGLPSNPVIAGGATATTAVCHGIEVAVEFKPVEHPIEPLDNDRPIQCPLPEPSILNVSVELP